MDFIIETIPLQQEPKRRYGVSPHRFLFNNQGISYATGMGCSRHDNCFECPYEDCRFLSGAKANDSPYMSNRGDGIKP